MKEVCIEVPADAEWGLPLRLALAGAGANCCLSVDVLDDVRMAADEACALLRAQPGAGSTIAGRAWRDERFFYVTLACGGAPTQDDITLGGGMTLAILQTLAPRVSLDGGDGGVRRVRFAFPLAC